MKNIKTPMAVGSLVLIGLLAAAANADHSWGSYHWDISTKDSPLVLGDNLRDNLRDNLTFSWRDSSDKPAHLLNASDGWNAGWSADIPAVLLNEVVKDGKSNAACDPVKKRVEVCNGKYGENGWVGMASIWVTRGRSKHIVQGVVKLNDTYFNTEYYNTPAWRDYVMCQEVGHTFGLDHQDTNEENTNIGTCMDYTNDPAGDAFSNNPDNRLPNEHDFKMLAEMYAHLNTTSDKVGGPGKGNGGGDGKPERTGNGADIDLNNPSEWGQAIRQDALGRNSVFERILANGQVLITHVLWVN